MKSKDIYQLVSTAVGFNIAVKTRKRKYVYAQSIANTLSRKFTNDSLEEIGKNCNKDHASVLVSIRRFDEIYKHQSDPINVLGIYNKTYQICRVKSQVQEVEELKETNINNLIEENIILKQSIYNEKQKRIDAEYNFRKEKRKIIKQQHPLLPLLHNIPEEHVFHHH